MKKLLLGMGVLLCTSVATAQSTLWKHKNWEARISEQGCLEQIVFKENGRKDTVPFLREDGQFMGPSFYVVADGKAQTADWMPDGYRSYRAVIDHVECRLTYKAWKGQPALEVTLINQGHVPFQPKKAGLRLGIDTYMEKYPAWFGKYFPTLMRNEKTHFICRHRPAGL